LIVGHDGGIKVFVDGQAAFCDPRTINPARPERSRIPVRLTPGTHEVAIAFDTDHGKGWGIFFRFEGRGRRPPSGRSSFPCLIRT
jgi:hypothetical protein